MTMISMQDILSLLHEDWVPEEKKQQIKNMILDTIDMAEEATKKLQESLGDK